MFTKNRDRLLTTDVAPKVLAAILAHREVAPLLSDEHFSVDGTLVKAWASMKSFQPKPEAAPPDGDRPDDPPPPPPAAPAADAETPVQTSPETAPMTTEKPRDRNAEVDFRGQKRSNATHTSGTDPEARLYKKSPGTGASLCFIGHTLMDEAGSATGPRNPPQGNGLIVQTDMTQAPSRQHAAHAPAGQWMVTPSAGPPSP